MFQFANGSHKIQTIPAHPRFPDKVREWIGFFLAVKMQAPLSGGQFPVFPTNTQSLRVEANAVIRFQNNVLWPVGTLLRTQGAEFDNACPGLLGSNDYAL